MSEPLNLEPIRKRSERYMSTWANSLTAVGIDRRDLLAEVERLRAELARRDEQIAAAWGEGEGAGWGRANRKWSDEPDLQRATNPYRGAS